MGDGPYRVVIVDDHDVVRTGLRTLLDSDDILHVVGEARTKAGAIRRVGLEDPDIVVMDLRLPDGSGIEACREIKTRWPRTQVIVLTSYADNEALIDAYNAGASGYVLKRVDSDGLVEAIHSVGRGDKVFGDALDSALAATVSTSGATADKRDRLSPQETRVLNLVAQGNSNKQIAEEMFLSDKTVKNYVSHILRKMEMASRTEAAAYSVKMEAKRRARYPSEDWPAE